MKLHLPKQLHSAVLATFAVVTAIAGPQAYADPTVFSGASNTNFQTRFPSPDAGVVFNMDNTGASNWFNSASYAGNVLIGADATVTDKGLCINNGNQNQTLTLSGKVTGTGLISKVGAGTNVTMAFTGDVTEFTGNIAMGSSVQFTMRFGGSEVTAPTTRTSAGVSGTGTITFSGNKDTLVYQYNAAESPVYITNAITKTAGTSKVNLKGGATYVFTKDVAIDNLTVDNGASLGFSGTAQFNTLSLGTNSTLNLLDGATIKLDSLTHSETPLGDETQSGLLGTVVKYQLASGGAVQATGTQSYTLGGNSVAATLDTESRNVSVSATNYLVASGDILAVGTVNDAISAAEGEGTLVNSIVVNGTLTGLTKPTSGSPSVPSKSIYGNGTVQIDGEMQYHNQNFLENFTGTVEIVSGETHIGNQGGKFSQVSQIKLTGGALKGWGTTFAKNILLAGGTLSAANDNMTYSGLVTVTADSAIEGVGTGKTTTLSGTVNVTTGELTIRGNVTHSSTFDMSGPNNARYNGSMKIATGATFTSNANLWVLNTTNILLEEGGKFVKGGYNITGQASGSAIKSNETAMIAMNNLTATNVTMAYSGDAATVSSTLAGSTTFKNTGSNLVTFSGSVGNDAVLEGVMGEDGVSNVKYTKNPTAGTGTIKNVNIENFDAGADNASIKMDGVVGTIRNSANVRTIELLDGGLTLTNANNFEATLKGSGNLVRSTANTDAATYTLSAAEWTGTFVNGSATTVINLTTDTSAAFETAEGGHLVINSSATGGRTIGGVVKDADLSSAGNLTLNGTGNELKSVNSTGGALIVNGDTTVSNDTQTTSTIHTFMSLGADTALALTGKSDMVVAGTGAAEGIWMKKGSSITVDSTSTLTAEGLTFSNASIANTNTTEEVQIGTHSNKESVRGDVHISGNVKVNEGTTSVGAYTMENGTLNVASGTTTTVNATLTNMDMNVAVDTEAKFNTEALALKNLTMAGGSQVTLGDNHTGALTLTKLTVTDAGAAINANLDLTDASLTLNGYTLDLGCSLTLGNTELNATLPTEENGALALFTGVDSLTLGSTAYTEATTVDASPYIRGLAANTYNLVYTGATGDNAGMVSIQKTGSSPVVPEPTTGTLSLLALAGLMARRRRK